MKKLLFLIFISINSVVYADNPFNPFPNIEGHWTWKIGGIVGILVTTTGMVADISKQIVLGLFLTIGSALMCFDYDIAAYIVFALGVIIIFAVKSTTLNHIIKK